MEFAAYDTTVNVGVKAYAPASTNLVTATTGQDVRITANPVDTILSPTLNSLNLAGNATVTLRDNAQAITLTSGGLLSSTTNVISQGSITAGANPLYINDVANTLALNSFITGTAGTLGVVYSGAGTTTLGGGSLGGSAANTYTGSTVLNNGVLTLARAAGVIAIPGNFTVVSGTVNLTNAEQIGDASNVTIANLNNSGTLVLSATAGINETIGSLTLNTILPVGVSGAGTLILSGADGNGNALTVTGGTITAQLRLSSTGGSDLRVPGAAQSPGVNGGDARRRVPDQPRHRRPELLGHEPDAHDQCRQRPGAGRRERHRQPDRERRVDQPHQERRRHAAPECRQHLHRFDDGQRGRPELRDGGQHARVGRAHGEQRRERSRSSTLRAWSTRSRPRSRRSLRIQ